MKPALPTSEAEAQANKVMEWIEVFERPPLNSSDGRPLLQHMHEMYRLRDYHHYRDLEGVCNRLYEQNSRIYWDVFPALRVMQTW